MSFLPRILGHLVDPWRIMRCEPRDAVRKPPCSPAPPRDPPSVRPPDSGCSTGPEPRVGFPGRKPARRRTVGP